MVIYEVNLTVEKGIFMIFYDWLIPHITKMLEFNGFLNAKTLLDSSASTDKETNTKLTVVYTVDSMKNLDHYLTHHSASMRKEGLEKFGNKFSATRRIFEIKDIFDTQK